MSIDAPNFHHPELKKAAYSAISKFQDYWKQADDCTSDINLINQLLNELQPPAFCYFFNEGEIELSVVHGPNRVYIACRMPNVQPGLIRPLAECSAHTRMQVYEYLANFLTEAFRV